MEQKPAYVDKVYITRRTSVSKSRAQDLILLAESLVKDVDREVRLEQHLCKSCYYFSRMSGQAFTRRPCGICNEVQTYSNTDTHDLCKPCAVENKLCKRCSAKMGRGV